MSETVVTAFFLFEDLSADKLTLQEELLALDDMKGLVLIADEGINGTVAGSPQAVANFRSVLEKRTRLAGLEYKDSYCEKNPFPRWKVELKDQVIQYMDKFRPKGEHNHLSAAEWHSLLHSGEELTVLDTRNRYEFRVGTFKNAIDPEIDKFTEFADYLDRCELPRDRTTLIFCTGGIRCEKAILDMEERGFEKVYQLEGGILKYLEEFPNQEFEGECFVFDRRVALDQNLEPSRQYWLCPHCGDPGQLEVDCAVCGGTARICDTCRPEKPTCCKNCQYHYHREKPPLSRKPS
ncbi:MAG: rhodanese-like domain-containing protein [Vulcanimicrobiota bacterium]